MKKKILKYLKIVSAVVTIIVIIFSPYLLVIDFHRTLPLVVLIWCVSGLYYIFILRKKEKQDNIEMEEDPDVSRETKPPSPE